KNIFIHADNDVVSIMASKKENELFNQITASAKQFNEEPEDAYIDSVWKKTPGRNGKMVNVEKSYENMKKSSEFDASLLVFDEIEPEVSLKDLPASPIYRGHPEKEMVALMINVSGSTEYIPGIIKTLKKENVRATFFLEGKWAKENKEMVKMIHEQGHVIGNHAYDHPDMSKMNPDEITEQIT